MSTIQQTKNVGVAARPSGGRHFLVEIGRGSPPGRMCAFRAMRTTVPMVFMLCSITSCKTPDATADIAFEPAHGWILVTNGNVSDLSAVVSEYDEIYREIRPAEFRVELHPQSAGAIAVLLPDGVPAFDLTNISSWLDASTRQADMHGAVAWVTAPGDGVKYYLEPEASNPDGDTLIGASALGQPVRVSLPENGLSKVSTSFAYIDEPRIERSPQPVTIKLTLDANPAYGNPRFVVDSPLDHDWRW